MQPTYSPRSDAARPMVDLIRQARQGVLRSRVDEVAARVSLTDIEMARVLNMSVRSLHGKSGGDTLSLASSERLLLLDRLIQHGQAVFNGRPDLLSRWLRTPLPELAYREGPELPPSSFSIREAGSFAEPEQVYQAKVTSGGGTLVPQSPLAVLDTVMGFSLVEDVLARIEWGIAG
jgi:uncharacterized protein (DUF2384 family)